MDHQVIYNIIGINRLVGLGIRGNTYLFNVPIYARLGIHIPFFSFFSCHLVLILWMMDLHAVNLFASDSCYGQSYEYSNNIVIICYI